MARRLLALYLMTVVGPVAVAAAAFGLQNLLGRRNPELAGGNGHTDPEALEYTVEEAQATP